MQSGIAVSFECKRDEEQALLGARSWSARLPGAAVGRSGDLARAFDALARETSNHAPRCTVSLVQWLFAPAVAGDGPPLRNGSGLAG